MSGKPVEWRELTEEENFEMFDAMGIPRHPAGDEFEKTGVKGITWNSKLNLSHTGDGLMVDARAN